MVIPEMLSISHILIFRILNLNGKQKSNFSCSFTSGVHNSNLMAGGNFFLTSLRAKDDVLTHSKGVFIKERGKTYKKIGILRGQPDKMLLRATFGPRAV